MNNLRESNKDLGSQIIKYEYIENVITQYIYVNVGVSFYLFYNIHFKEICMVYKYLFLKVALNTITLIPNHSIMILFLLLEETYIRDVHKLDRPTSKYGDILNKCIRQRKRSTKCNVLRVHIISKNIGGQVFFSFFRYYIACHLIYGF